MASIDEKLSRQLAQSGIEKIKRGEKPSAREQSAISRLEKGREEELRWQYYKTVPQKHYRDMSGRQPKILIEQQTRYGIPFGGATVDLTTVLRKFHDLLAKYSHLFGSEDDAALMGGGDSPNLERLRLASACLKEMDLEERRGTHVPRAEISPELVRLAGNVRIACEDVRRRWGNEPAELIIDAINETEQGWLKVAKNTNGQADYGDAVRRDGGDEIAKAPQPS